MSCYNSIVAICLLVLCFVLTGPYAYAQEDCDQVPSIHLLSYDCDSDQGVFMVTIEINGDPNQEYLLTGVGIGAPLSVMGLDTQNFCYSDGTALAYSVEAVENANCTAFYEHPVIQCSFIPTISQFSFACVPESDSTELLITPAYIGQNSTLNVSGHPPFMLTEGVNVMNSLSFNLPSGSDYEISVVEEDGDVVFFSSGTLIQSCVNVCDFDVIVDVASVNGSNQDFNVFLTLVGAPNSVFNVSDEYIVTPNATGITVVILGPIECQSIFEEIVSIEDSFCEPILISFEIGCGLAIELLRFEGEALSEGNLITWTTGTEIATDYFTLERSLNGTTNWDIVGIIPGSGNSNASIDYASLDTEVPQGRAYYRLKETDLSGETNVASQVIQLIRSTGNFEINHSYPVPTNDLVYVSISAERTEITKAQVFDISGKEVASFKVRMNHGINELELDLSE